MNEETRRAIDAIVRERLEGAQVKRVFIAEDEDFEGDQIYRVTVVFDDVRGQLDPHRTLGLARHLRSRLERQGMPFTNTVFTFMSQADAGKMLPEAA